MCVGDGVGCGSGVEDGFVVEMLLVGDVVRCGECEVVVGGDGCGFGDG